MVKYSQKVEDLVQRVADTVNPLRIILFGSAARQDAGPQSDIDLLVVMPDWTHRRQISQKTLSLDKGDGSAF